MGFTRMFSHLLGSTGHALCARLDSARFNALRTGLEPCYSPVLRWGSSQGLGACRTCEVKWHPLYLLVSRVACRAY